MIEQVKTLLGLSDNSQDELLRVIFTLTKSHYLALTRRQVVEQEHEFIIIEVMVKRFNRIGHEGMSSQSAEGVSFSFPESDFDEYKEFLFKRNDGVKFI